MSSQESLPWNVRGCSAQNSRAPHGQGDMTGAQAGSWKGDTPRPAASSTLSHPAHLLFLALSWPG